MGIKELAVSKSDMFRVDPRVLTEEPGWNVRTPSKELDNHIRTLANSIKSIGIQVPLKIRMNGEVPVVVNGHCRLAATLIAIAEGADIQSVPVVMEERNCSKEDRVFSMVTCNEGKPLAILERAEVYKRLMGWGWTEEVIAEKSGKSITHVRACMTLIAACPEIKKLVSEGKVAATLALKLIGEMGEEKALAAMVGAVQTAEVVGKEKASRKHVGTERAPAEVLNKKMDWKKWGPKLAHALEAICTCPAKGKGSERMGDYLVQGNEILQQLEDAGFVKE